MILTSRQGNLNPNVLFKVEARSSFFHTCFDTSCVNPAKHPIHKAIHFCYFSPPLPVACLAVVQSYIESGTLPLDPSGIYVILTSSDVTTPGFCSPDGDGFCGKHSNMVNINGIPLIYAFVGNTATCNSCQHNR